MNQPLLKQYNEKDIVELLKNNVHLVYVDTGSEEVVARYEDLPDIIVDINDKLGYVVDLNTCLEPETVAMVKDRLIYHEDLDGNVVPMAIDITDTKYVKDMGIQGDKIFLSFVADSSNSEFAKEFVTYIISREI